MWYIHEIICCILTFLIIEINSHVLEKNNRIKRKVKCQYFESRVPGLDQILELSLVCLSFSIQQAYFYLKHSKFVVPFQLL